MLPNFWISADAVFSPTPGTPLILSIVSPVSAWISTSADGSTPKRSRTSRSPDSPIAHRVPQRHVRADQLHEILVRGDERDDEILFRRALGERADHVVSLEAFDHQRLDAKRLDRAMDIRNLHDEIVGRLAAIRLVVGEQVVAKSPLRRVEDDRDMRRARVLQQLQQHPDEAVNRLGRQPMRSIHRRQRMKRAEDVSGAVDQNQLFAFRGHQSKLSDTVLKAKASRKQIENIARHQYHRIDSIAWRV